ncbi:acetyl- transporter 1 [Pyrenophora seminiperda CCB06]|uniref:Acetyl-transporter 1 n=1 Tax=Pyrenophora seminiperda CCB06 TaxID=1302712 RepID=A0A3M7MEQ9_9PLEO|nr:acetyl- transporter 1 [Pyrenophora seminiperda CCB06]
MSKRASRSKNRGSVLREQSSTDSLTQTKNGNADTTATMNGVMLEHRRKHSTFDNNSPASQAASLMGNSRFSLDDDVPKFKEEEDGPSKGFFELSKKDQSNFLLLVLLYFLQGIPMGLAHGSVPFLLKHNVSYAAIGVFSLAAYPYSLKLLWSPIVDAVWSPRVGRRKSWILPIQTISGFSMIWLGKNINRMMKEAGETDSGVWNFTWWWFALVFLCATQDIAVDGWALTLLSNENLAYASTAQTVGLTAGQFLSYTVFLAFNSKDFANRWFRSVPAETGIMELDGYLSFWGWAYLIVTFGLAEQLSLVILVDFPVEVFLGYYIGKWCQTYPPMHIWCWSFIGRLVAAGFAQFVVSVFPAGGAGSGFVLLVIAEHVMSTFMNTVMFVSVSAFHAKISDPLIGGTYMTLLATVSNLGGTFPRYFVLKAVDMFTSATCIPPTNPPKADLLKGPLVTQAFSCALEPEKHRCIEGGGFCNVTTDGYYIVNILCIVIGVVTFWGYIKPAVMRIQALPMRAWRISP